MKSFAVVKRKFCRRGKKVLPWKSKFCRGKVTFAVRKKVLPCQMWATVRFLCVSPRCLFSLMDFKNLVYWQGTVSSRLTLKERGIHTNTCTFPRLATSRLRESERKRGTKSRDERRVDLYRLRNIEFNLHIVGAKKLGVT